MQVHEGPGYAGDAVEPEARNGREVAPDSTRKIILVGHVLGVVAQEELGESVHLHRPGDQPTKRVSWAADGLFAAHTMI